MSNERICPYCLKTYIPKHGAWKRQCCHRKRCLKKHYTIRYATKLREKRKEPYLYGKKEQPIKPMDPLPKCSKCGRHKPMRGNHFLCEKCYHYASFHLNEDTLFWV